MSDNVIPSEFDNQAVLYVDYMRLQHSGIVAGQSADGKTIYVQSTRPDIPPRQWHFKVKRDLIDGMLVKPAANT